MPRRVYIGTAGWSIPRASADRCSSEGTHLERYARVFGCAEINSSFHRPHSANTYAKWAKCAPASFRFAVKVPRTITHDQQLRRARPALDRFLDETAGLGRKRGPLLVQLPPSLEFHPRAATTFFALLRERYRGAIVCEPRHESWFSLSADALLIRHEVGRVAADPARAPGADRPGGWRGVIYYRLHGSPRTYWSKYDATYIERLAAALQTAPRSVDVWCVFDNTASGAALDNALSARRAGA
jgi:uncharacterized protein YecE (DUF72 family)